MRLELSELLACPRCGPPRGVVVSVDRMERRRVLEGFLSCPECEARFPIRGGVIEFGPGADPAPGAGRDEQDSEDALRLAALLDLGEGGGFVLLGRGLSGVAPAVAELAPGVELVSLVDAPSAEAAARVNRARGVSEASLPLRDGRLRGAALVGGGGGALAEAARAVRPGGRVVVLRPAAGIASAASGLPLDVLASEPAAIVAARR